MAFKEWAVVVDALGRGEQILVLRKGGIAEGRGGFQPEHERFWLFPTAFHQQRESIIPEARTRFDSAVAPVMAEGTVPIQYFVQLETAHEVTSLEAALSLSGQHIWTEEVVRSRFDWGGSQRIFALLFYVFALPKPVAAADAPRVRRLQVVDRTGRGT
ncbi:MAG: DUF1802 family protein [Rhodospirillales bacterium]|nr:DUF1802 family protein [Rhodospirillales bacterium]